MKIKNKIKFTALALCSMMFVTSCVDDKVDLNNISGKVQLGETYAIPIGTSDISMEALLKENAKHINGLYKIEIVDGVVALTYDTTYYIPNLKMNDGNPHDTIYNVNYNFYEDLPAGTIIKPSNPYVVITSKNSAKANIDLQLNKITGNLDRTSTPVSYGFIQYDSLMVIPENSEASEKITNKGKSTSTATLGELIGEESVVQYSLHFTYQAKEGKSGLKPGEAMVSDYLSIHVKFVMPLWFEKGCHFTYTDTIKDLKINDLLDNDYVTEATIRFTAENSFPFGGKVTFAMLDAGYNKIKTLKEYTYDIKSANVDANGYSTNATNDTIWLKYDENMIEDLKNAKNLLVTVSSYPKPLENKMRITQSNRIIFKGGMYTNGGIRLDDREGE